MEINDIFSISKLIVKKKLKSLTDAEKSRLKQYEKEFPLSKEVDFDYVVQKTTDYSNIDTGAAWKSVLEKYKKENNSPLLGFAILPMLKYAAILVCLLGLGYFFYNQLSKRASYSERRHCAAFRKWRQQNN